MPEARKPVFLSYARRSAAASARALHAALGPDTCFLDKIDVEPLEEFPRRLSDALLGARLVVVFADETYFERWYCLREWLLAIAPWLESGRSGAGVDEALALGHVIVALPPGGLSAQDEQRLPSPVKRWNLPAADDAKGLAALVHERLRAAGPTLAERCDAMRVPAHERDALAGTHVLPPLRMGKIRCTDNLRPSIREAFVGRADDFWQLHHVLSTQRMGGSQVAALTAALQGGGGFGKTRLAVEYAHRLGPAAYPGGVFWVDASEPERFGTELRTVLRAALPAEKRAIVDELRDRDLREHARAALAECAQEGEVLYVVDNLPEAEAGSSPSPVGHFCPALEEVTCLVTSRNLQGYGGTVRPLSVDVLDVESAVKLLTRGVEESALAAEEWVTIARWTGRLPLVLELLNGALAATPPREILAHARGSDEVARVADRYVEALRGQVPDEDLRSMAQVFELSYERLDPTAQRVARTLAWCAPNAIPRELLDELAGDEERLRVRTQLVHRSFVALSSDEGALDGSVSMHRLLASYLRSLGDGKEERGRLLACLAGRFVEGGTEDPAARPLLAALLPHLGAQIAWTRRDGPVAAPSVWEGTCKALSELGERTSDPAPLLVWIDVSRGLVESARREEQPAARGRAQVWLGIALQSLGEREGDGAKLAEAVAASRAALEVYTQEALPLQWAMTQNNLGTALQSLGEREGDGAKLAEAVAASRAALEVYTQEALPLQWATTQNNLGNALSSLGEREGDGAKLAEAVAAYRAALEVRTQEALPLDWAMTQNNLGNALQSLGEREGDGAKLAEAVAAYRAALEVYTQEALPLQWATTQNNLGTALSSLGEREGDGAKLAEAVAAFRAALEVYTQEALPLDWAMTQNNLGNALRSLGEREGEGAKLAEAVAAYRAALEVYDPIQTPHYHGIVSRNLTRAIDLLRGLEEDGEAS